MHWLLSGIRLSSVYMCGNRRLWIERPLLKVYVVHNDTNVFVWISLISLIGHVLAEYLGITAWQFIGQVEN